MDLDEYRKRGKEMVDYIADYHESIRNRRVFPSVKPGYMRTLMPNSAPYEGESWENIFSDIERVIMPGVTHWQSPYMHAYFPALNSPASLLGDMLADGLGCLAFTWASSPACTELEIIVLDWLGKMIGLPDDFLHLSPYSKGGGVIQTTSSEATFVCLLAARTEAIRRVKQNVEAFEDAEINSRLVGYASDQGHSSIEKAGLIGLVKMRYIESDEKLSLRGDKLKEAIRHDKEKGLIPFFAGNEVEATKNGMKRRKLVGRSGAGHCHRLSHAPAKVALGKRLCATLGTTGACAFDNLREIGPICKSENIWIHVDAAYAGTAFICPEFRKWMNGIDLASSFAFNPSKWMMVHFDCTAMWVKNSSSLHRTFNVEPLYLQHENSGLAVDFMHWQISLSRRFRALKLWFVIRNYGVKGLQEHVRKGVRLAKEFEEMVFADKRFEIPAKRYLGMVVFRIKGENELTETLLKKINSTGLLHCVPASLQGKYVIRFTVTSAKTTSADIHRDWTIIQELATRILHSYGVSVQPGSKPIPLAEVKKRNPDFGTSLLLANAPMTPKVMNGSFVAIFDCTDVVQEFMRRYGDTLRMVAKDSPALRRRVRGLLVSERQFSLDSRMDLMNTLVASTVRVDGEQEENQSLTRRGSVGSSSTRKDQNGKDAILEDEEESSEGSASPTGAKRCKKCGQIIVRN